MKQLNKELFATMTPLEIETFLNEMFEAYLQVWGCSQYNLGDCHFVKRKLIEVVNKLDNQHT